MGELMAERVVERLYPEVVDTILVNRVGHRRIAGLAVEPED